MIITMGLLTNETVSKVPTPSISKNGSIAKYQKAARATNAPQIESRYILHLENERLSQVKRNTSNSAKIEIGKTLIGGRGSELLGYRKKFILMLYIETRAIKDQLTL